MEKIIYSDGNDYSHLEANRDEWIDFIVEGDFDALCVMCGSENITILDDKDICHDCGYIYT